MTKLKHLDLNQKSFKGKSNKEYLFTKDLSIRRFIEFEKLQAHVGFGLDFNDIFNKLKTVHAELDKGKLAQPVIIVHNLMNGIALNLDNRVHPAIKLCALFFNTEDEDLGDYDEEAMNRKVDDWKEYATQDFFHIAVNLVNGFIPIYKEISQSILKAEQAKLSSTDNTAEK